MTQAEVAVRNIQHSSASTPFTPSIEDWSVELLAIFELILHNQHSLAQAATLSFASQYRESCIFKEPRILQCAQKLWKIAIYIDLIEGYCLHKKYAKAVDTLPDIVRLSYELQEIRPFQHSHHQILISYLCQNKLK